MKICTDEMNQILTMLCNRSYKSSLKLFWCDWVDPNPWTYKPTSLVKCFICNGEVTWNDLYDHAIQHLKEHNLLAFL